MNTDDTSDTPGVRRSRRLSRVLVASVAVLLVGAGGAYVAASAGAGSSPAPAGHGTPPPLPLDGYGEAGTPGIAVGEPNPYGTVYTARGDLPEGPRTAPVYWARGAVTRDEVARLATALKVAGTPRLVGDAWQVGAAGDGSAPALRVSANAPGMWTFSAYTPGGDDCARGKACRPGGGGASGQGPGPVSEEAARKAAAPVLKAIGQDTAKLDASQLMDRVRVVNADPEVGGLPTYGWSTGLRIGPEGTVVGGNGNLVAPVKGAAYPVVGAQKALDLMNRAPAPSGGGRMGPGGCAAPVPVKDRDEGPCRATAADAHRSVAVKGAVFGLAAHSVGARPVLVPSWLFQVRPEGDGQDVTVTRPAIDPTYLTPPKPAGQPSPSTSAGHRVDVMGYAADGRDLTLAYEGGVCADYAASVREDSDRVTVTVTDKPWKGKNCIMIAKVYRTTLHLKAPLGDRRVVGADGRTIARKAPGALPKPAPGGVETQHDR
ncbi:hypothetical protein AB0C59_23505 [Streptomyces sp. NPDC048664]|uniref:hypothetical protein n=1 Tax=Streptomyces sp. NPDC048664 TaxID=3154505 RepID=UPI00341DBEF5